MRTYSDKALIQAIRHTRDYLIDCKFHAALMKWHYAKARRILSVDTSHKWGWRLRFGWNKRLREIGLDPESLAVVDAFRWNVALELIHDASVESFPIEEYRRRLAVARLNSVAKTENAPEASSQRRAVLEGLGIELD